MSAGGWFSAVIDRLRGQYVRPLVKCARQQIYLLGSGGRREAPSGSVETNEMGVVATDHSGGVPMWPRTQSATAWSMGALTHALPGYT